MSASFHAFEPDACALCGSRTEPSGEHKIKASSLRDQFGGRPMVIVSTGGASRSARGPKSKQFHFSTPFCAPCNNARTQDTDLEWDRFRRSALALIAAGREPVAAFDDPRYEPDASGHSKPYLAVLRYLAKLMAGHLADSAAPRSERLSRFALGLSDDCPLWIEIVRGATYSAQAHRHGDHPYAAHGGLILISNRESGEITGFHTAISISALQCTIRYRLDDMEVRNMNQMHSEFSEWCRDRAAEAAEPPIPTDELVKLGLQAGPEA